MKLRTITARASRTLPHPTESYANFKADLELTAELDEGDDEAACIRDLQSRAECAVEQHCHELSHSIGEFARVVEARNRIPKLEAQVQSLTRELEDAKAAGIDHLPLFAGSKTKAGAT